MNKSDNKNKDLKKRHFASSNKKKTLREKVYNYVNKTNPWVSQRLSLITAIRTEQHLSITITPQAKKG